MQHADVKQPAACSQIVLLSPCVSLADVQIAAQMTRPLWSAWCVTLPCHGGAIFPHISPPHISVLPNPLAAHFSALYQSLFSPHILVSLLTLAGALLRAWSVLGSADP